MLVNGICHPNKRTEDDESFYHERHPYHGTGAVGGGRYGYPKRGEQERKPLQIQLRVPSGDERHHPATPSRPRVHSRRPVQGCRVCEPPSHRWRAEANQRPRNPRDCRTRQPRHQPHRPLFRGRHVPSRRDHHRRPVC